MFENLSYLALQQYWWVIISVLGALFVFLTFVQGGQTLIYRIGKNENEKSILLNTLGRKWEFTFTTLVTFGGAFFASFPLFYATSFGGAYWVWLLILAAFIIQAVAYEFRKKPANFLGAKTYEIFLVINGLLGTILIGTAVGTFFNGAQFSLNDMNQVIWQTPYRGLEAVFTFHNVALGLSVFFLARVLGLLYFIFTVDHDLIVARSQKQLFLSGSTFLIFFLYFLVWLLLKEGFAVNPETGEVFMEKYKYMHNLLQMPVIAGILLVGIAGVLWGIISTMFKHSTKGFWFAGSGTVLTVFALFIMAGFNNTAFYPSAYDLQSSLTIQNASSSKFTLTAMSYVSLMIPFVLAYIIYFWRAMNREKITEQEIKEESHVY
ncbi:cytochrome bd-I ubiquinol oxidase subunit 2 apoprotein [Tangfeifania diversioriginum]|uniref:Cytochrome bd-I ubiquinol oxidase subunit 2 apoprotein n=1 Tax=Tangfeifania diversioriginum TaxID=1168035 RepID=A0A1M6DFI4_9BACT|nr:cytochrome d ubiquinol oxidase subunit II [Tangfeifania diversioriginum]SHI71925.1 cytochrome bd-I ubiquinol oxidase subunit 2 apoprotein [Tangfeifania diversioriginum]